MLRWAIGLVAAIFALASGVSARAQSQQNWNGPYIGANIGYGSADIDGGIVVLNPSAVPYAHGPLNYSIDAEGGFGGIQIGINRRDGHAFAGIEADFQGSGISGSATTSFAPPTIFPFTYTSSVHIDWFSTVRARLGIATDDMLIYVTAGVAIGNLDCNATYLIPQNNAYARVNSSEARVGYVLGAGIERALQNNWALKLEYQYINFGEQQAQGALFFVDGSPSRETVISRIATDMQTVRIGLNYYFQAPL